MLLFPAPFAPSSMFMSDSLSDTGLSAEIDLYPPITTSSRLILKCFVGILLLHLCPFIMGILCANYFQIYNFLASCAICGVGFSWLGGVLLILQTQ